MLTVQFDLWNIACNFIWTVRSLVCLWKPFCGVKIVFWSHLHVKISTNSLESLRTEVTGTQESYRYLQAQFSHRSQGALGKYSSLQLTLKTIAQTTALRQKEVNYFHGCYMILVAVLPTFIFSTSGKVDKFHKAFDSFFSPPKPTMNRHILLWECHH